MHIHTDDLHAQSTCLCTTDYCNDEPPTMSEPLKEFCDSYIYYKHAFGETVNIIDSIYSLTYYIYFQFHFNFIFHLNNFLLITQNCYYLYINSFFLSYELRETKIEQ